MPTKTEDKFGWVMAQDFNREIDNVGRIEAVPTILEVVRRITGMGFVVIGRVTEDRWIACSVLDEIGFGLEAGGEVEIETTICNVIRGTREPVVIEDVAEDEVWSKHPAPALYGFRSCIAVPIILADGSFFGTLCAIDPRPVRLKTPEILGMFQLFAELIAKHLDAYKKLAETESALLEKSAVAELQEKALHVSEERYRAVVETQAEMICRCRPDGTLTFVNDAYCRYFGRTRYELLGANFLELLSKAEQRRVRALMKANLEGRHSGPTDHSHPVPDGSVRWTQWVNQVIRDQDGQVEIQSIGWDITEQKRAQEALQKSEKDLRASHAQIRQLAGRLMKAQEEERRHIARELHDDLIQRIAGISISLSGIRRQLPSSDALIQQVNDVQERANHVANAMRSLSHELHPAVLEQAGLVAALESLVAEFNSAQGARFTLRAPEHLGHVPNEVALCIFRVAQESLRNVANHSGAQHAYVELSADDADVTLVIQDDGDGFEIESVRTKGGLGLASMAERVQLLQGEFEVQTHPAEGTVLRATVPVTHAVAEQPGGTTQSKAAAF